MDDIDDVINNLKRLAAPDSLGAGVSHAEIDDAERCLGVSFPQSYRRFLERVGFALWPAPVYGIHQDVVPGHLVVDLTLGERTEVEPEMPLHLVPISPDGWGNHYCLDTGAGAGGECPVVFWNHELDEDQTPRLRSQSFTQWLRDMIEAEREEEAGRSG